MSIIKRDPKDDQPVDGDEIFVRLIDGTNAVGKKAHDEDVGAVFLANSLHEIEWTDVECWAPPKWTDAPTTESRPWCCGGNDHGTHHTVDCEDHPGEPLGARFALYSKTCDERDAAISRAEKAEAYCAELVERAVKAEALVRDVAEAVQHAEIEEGAGTSLIDWLKHLYVIAEVIEPDLRKKRDRAIEERDAALERVRILDAAAIDTDEAREIIEKGMQPVPPPRDVALVDIVRTIVEDRIKALLSMARAVEERDALGLQLAALRDQGERYVKALGGVRKLVNGSGDGYSGRYGERHDVCRLLTKIDEIAADALTHGVDVTKEGE